MKALFVIIFLLSFIGLVITTLMLSAMKNKFIQVIYAYNSAVKKGSIFSLKDLNIKFNHKIKHYMIDENDIILDIDDRDYNALVRTYFDKCKKINKLKYVFLSVSVLIFIFAPDEVFDK